jgi:hypothetical protein
LRRNCGGELSSVLQKRKEEDTNQKLHMRDTLVSRATTKANEMEIHRRTNGVVWMEMKIYCR